MSTATATLPNAATSTALKNTMLTPRFYTTDFAAMDRMNIEPIRAQWDALMQEFRNDTNTDHFQRRQRCRATSRSCRRRCTRSSSTS